MGSHLATRNRRIRIKIIRANALCGSPAAIRRCAADWRYWMTAGGQGGVK